jgi:ABC-type branched-subunit amino acid transport system ATPase component
MMMQEQGTRREERGTKTEPEGAILKVTEVSKSFEGVQALLDVGFEVRTGHIKALIGPNGAGKTTLLNVINGLLAPDSGQVYLRGQELMGMKTEQIALLGVSRTFQLIRLFTVNNATVLDNVLLGAHKHVRPTISGALFLRGRNARAEKAVRERAMEALSFVGVEWAANMVPGALSFGNQRLVELARSLMSEPDLLLLDEPASGLNDAEVDRFMELMAAIRERGITILLVEHNMRLVMRVSDDIVVLDFGKHLAEGDPAAICANPAVIEAYLGAECKLDGGSA